MTDTDDIELPPNLIRTIIASLAAALLLFVATLAAYRSANKNPGNIILPGGTTYLGPTEDDNEPAVPNVPTADGIYYSVQGENWGEHSGQIYPFVFDKPDSLSLGFFPDDPFDSVTVFYEDTNPSENILVRVEDLSTAEDKQQYIGDSKEQYARDWGKQYIWVNVEELEPFTNAGGLSGYKVIYSDGGGNRSGANFFFEVPGRPELVIWMSSRIINEADFNAIVDSLRWEG